VRLAGNERVYRTGDIVRYGWDGELTFIGRRDDSAKIRGHRVSPAEVESALCLHPEIKDAIVAVRESSAGAVLCAHYVAAAELAPKELRAWLTDLVPGYMVPSLFVRIAKVPVTPSGKKDRNALEVPLLEGSVARATGPRCEIETRLIDIWARLLERSELSVEQDFFELGGHSLLAIQLVQEIENTIDRRCSVADVFRNPTIERLADVLRRRPAS
jgi:acyl carrier protein